jgi:hypothetical protein
MNNAKRFDLSLALLAAPCAGPGATGTTIDFDRQLGDCTRAHRYSHAELVVRTRQRGKDLPAYVVNAGVAAEHITGLASIGRLRDGDGLNDVIHRLGGTRRDVRCAELVAAW